jgi:hypothetical protein
MSAELPGGKAKTNLTGFAGYDCAITFEAAIEKISISKAFRIFFITRSQNLRLTQ